MYITYVDWLDVLSCIATSSKHSANDLKLYSSGPASGRHTSSSREPNTGFVGAAPFSAVCQSQEEPGTHGGWEGR